jgi:L-ascorbate metabolism protein UlaG (beta-lactamase superfamily)
VKITKHEHACLVIEKSDKKLIVDPGDFTDIKVLSESYDAVYISHIHADHFTVDNIATLARQNPEILVVANSQVIEAIKTLGLSTLVVATGHRETVAGFDLQFCGDDHAVIYQTSPCKNLGLVVDGRFYYPGDSLVVPQLDLQLELVATPSSAPWLKISEVMDFIKAIRAKKIFPTHNALLSVIGEKIFYNWLAKAAEQAETEWTVMLPGESNNC